MSGSKSHHVRMFAGVVTAALLLAFLCLPFIRCVFAETPVCADLLQTTPEQKLNYLRRDRAKLNPDCVVYAIQELGARRYNAGAYVLATYLDFRVLGTEQRRPLLDAAREFAAKCPIRMRNSCEAAIVGP